MPLLSLIAVVVVVGVVAWINYISNTKRDRLPAGIQQLPGPKGL